MAAKKTARSAGNGVKDPEAGWYSQRLLKRTERSIVMEQTQHSFAERVLRDMYDAVLVLDGKGRIAYVNGPAARMLEVDVGFRDTGERFSFLAGDEYNDSFKEAIFAALDNKNETTVRKVPYMAPSGRKYVFVLSSSFLRDTEGVHLVITLSDETTAAEMTRKFRDSSNTFTTFLFAFCGWILVYALWEFLGRPVAADFMTHGVELLGVIMLIFILHRTSFTWHDLGVVPHQPIKTVRTALIVAVCAFAFLCGLKAVCRLVDPNCFEPEAPFLDLSRFGLRQLLYILTAGIQEFLARSVIQGNLKRITEGRHTALLAIFLSSMIFAALHIHFGFLFMVGAAILAGLEGVLYEKQQNIFGVWIVHWVFGVSGTLLCLIDH
jgi:membrane protease YdiL (CAAX protease family)